MVTIIVPATDFRKVDTMIKKSGSKFYPYIKRGYRYVIKFVPANDSLVTFLLLTYNNVELVNKD